jgi:hypothetical protein
MAAHVENARGLVEMRAVCTLADFVDSVKQQQEVPMVWLQWECTDRSLSRRAIQLADKIVQISSSQRFDPDQLALGFINSQHGADTQAFLDEFVLYDANTGEIEYRVVPYRKDAEDKDRAYVFHKSMGFRKPLFKGRWPDLRRWFTQYDPEQREVRERRQGRGATQKGVRTAGQVTLPKSVKFDRKQVEQAA